MNDCYWGGVEDQYYYEVDSGRIVGEIKLDSDLVYEAFYFDAWNNPNLGRYIDDARARKVVETARQREVEKWDRLRTAWNAPSVEEVCPVQTPKKTWWKIWE